MVFVECLLSTSLYYKIYVHFFYLNCVINPWQGNVTPFYRDEEAAISRQNNDNLLKSQAWQGFAFESIYAWVCSVPSFA